MADDVSLGTLEIYEVDQPWWYCHFTPTSAFEEVRPLFTAEQTAFEADEAERMSGRADAGSWDEAYNAIDALKLRLIADDGQVIDTLLLHIEDNEAWFRY
jgi:hypothetical protein